ncbi:M23 family metallopeptidase [Alicyclobacillus macrosporangiidus]|uniref:M23 family metallopeptidase n=1 Tax=Alicyclobacillus macrosporangiidus TaxID=392015 RepID=UPI0026F13561|nr:M23 family metallopeptidase [Alicyclobacillus macrosporangiidus]
MRAPWPGGITYRCNQGNFGPYSHSNPFDCYAWDFDLPMNAPVVAATNGVIAFAGYKQTDGYGIRVRVRNINGTYSLYAHLNQLFVQVGQSIKEGQLIGLAGNTGNTTGPHLHFSIINTKGISLPSIFSDIGVPIEGKYYTSQNWIKS